MAKDTAKGLTFLHGSDPPTLHNDLKSSNLLVSHNWLCKVSDFGLTSLKGTRTQVCYKNEKKAEKGREEKKEKEGKGTPTCWLDNWLREVSNFYLTSLNGTCTTVYRL
jgi:serine/threonine protein kinase